ncbi:MAG: (2Fe-2S)-binding protein [Actinophytocola sp.]|uniref:(2Fe-2S)-binding protein n=1 Tax=Actinophytocola sp. TaxID=1872138 RepID=UPI003C7436AD
MSTFSFDGDDVTAVHGQSIGAALLAAGHRSLRTTRHDGAPRGLFCGIGICFDCLVVVNGRPGLRACVTEARDGDVVETQEGTGRDHLAC